MLNLLPFSTLHVTVVVIFELSVVNRVVQTTIAVERLRSFSISWLGGQITVGASVSVKESNNGVRLTLHSGRMFSHIMRLFSKIRILIVLYTVYPFSPIKGFTSYFIFTNSKVVSTLNITGNSKQISQGMFNT